MTSENPDKRLALKGDTPDWVDFDPFQGNQITWSEDYDIYASTTSSKTVNKSESCDD